MVDLSKAPTIMQGEIGEIFRTSQLVAPNGTMGIFGDFQTDDEAGILLLNIGRRSQTAMPSLQSSPATTRFKRCSKASRRYPMSKAKPSRRCNEQLEANFLGLLVKHREAIFEGLFGGGDSELDIPRPQRQDAELRRGGGVSARALARAGRSPKARLRRRIKRRLKVAHGRSSLELGDQNFGKTEKPNAGAGLRAISG